jgi:hypothetical protein
MRNEVEDLKHRIAMIEDDIKVILAFIHKEGLEEQFEKPTEMADHCNTHFSNIEIACDLSCPHSLDWNLFI